MKAPTKGGWLAFSLVAVMVFALSLGQAFALSAEAIGTSDVTSKQKSLGVCPRDSDGWSSEQNGPLQSKPGAVEYCAKGGSENSQGCTGYLVQGSFSEVQAAVNAEGACGLSHWTYKLGPTPTNTPVTPTATPTLTPTPDPTSTPTEGPSPTPTNTPEESPTPSNTPPPSPTDPPDEEPPTGPGDANAIAAIGYLLLAGGMFVTAAFGVKKTLAR